MNNIYRKIIEYTSTGEIGKEAAVKLLAMLKAEETRLSDDIAIIGIALKFPGADTPEEFWENICNGIDCISDFPEDRRQYIEEYFIRKYGLNTESLCYQPGAYLKRIEEFDYRFFKMSPKEAALMDPAQRLFLLTAWRALEDAGYSQEALAGSKTGVYVGYSPNTDYFNMIEAMNPEQMGFSRLGNMPVLLPTRIAYLMDLKGPTMLIDTACSSSLVAVHLACQAIRDKECTMAIAGGIRINLITIFKESDLLGVESQGGRTRSFDDYADGAVWGEGAAALILKPLSQARKDGDNIYAVIKGIGINQDGASIGITAPNSRAQAEAIIQAWENAGIDPETISYIEAHGTATNLGDPLEIEGIQRAFRKYTDKKQFCAVSTVKSNMGHLYECAGMAGLVKAIMALKSKKIPGSIHFTKPNAKIDFSDSPVFINTKTVDWEPQVHPRRCGVSSFGFSGTNCHVILEEYIMENPASQTEKGTPCILTLSAKSREGLGKLLDHYIDYLSREETSDLRDICYTSNTGRTHYNHRCAVIADDRKDLLAKLINIRKKDQVDQATSFYGKHELVSAKKTDREPGDILEAERRELSRELEQLLQEYAVSDKNSVELLAKICCLYVKGAVSDFKVLYQKEKRRTVSLPSYPFDFSQCWFEFEKGEKAVSDLLYTMAWREKPAIGTKGSFLSGKIVVLRRSREEGRQILQAMEDRGFSYMDVIVHRDGGSDQPHRDQALEIENTVQDYRRLFQLLEKEDCSCILHLLGYENPREAASADELKKIQDYACGSMFYLAQGYVNSRTQKQYRILLLTDYMNEIDGREGMIKPHNATLYGIGKVIHKELVSLNCRLLDIDDETDPRVLFEEDFADPRHYAVGYRKNIRYTEVFTPVCEGMLKQRETIAFKDKGVYLITGGMGGIGLEIARCISEQVKAHIILLNRSPLPAGGNWTSLYEQCGDSKLKEKFGIICQIEEKGSDIEYVIADVSDETAMEEAIKAIAQKYGKIDGIIHGAGVSADKPIMEKSKQEFMNVIAAKVYGTWILDKVTEQLNPDFMILFSSVATAFSAYGQSDYAAANAYIDAFQAYRNRKNKRTVVINWTTWLETGMAANSQSAVDAIFTVLRTKTAIEGFHKVLETGVSHAIVGRVNYEGIGSYLLEKANVELAEQIQRNIGKHRKRGAKQKEGKPTGELKLLGRKDQEYSDSELLIGQAWEEVLGYQEISIDDNFFELGGDSILGVKIANILTEKSGKGVTTVDILKYLTIRELAEYMDSLPKAKPVYPPVARAEKQDHYPASFEQINMYLANRLNKDGLNYNMYRVAEIKGEVDYEKIRSTFEALIRRHEILRTTVSLVDGEVVQTVAEDFAFQLEILEAREEAVSQVIKEFRRPFDMGVLPLFRVGILRTGTGKHMLLLDLHHSVTDGVSMEILKEDFARLYRGDSLEEPRLQYKDYAVWQHKLMNTELMENQKNYWLKTFENGVPKLLLPTDYDRPEILEFEGDTVVRHVDPDFKDRLAGVSAQLGVTNYVVLMSAYFIMLSKYTAQEAIVVGAPVFGRHIPELKEIMGIFIRMLPIYARPEPELSAAEFIGRLREILLSALGNQDFNINSLSGLLHLPKDLGRHNLFDTLFVLQNIEEGKEQPSDFACEFKDDEVYNISDYDLTMEVKVYQGDIQFTLEYNTKLFRRKTAEVIMEDYLKILEAILKDTKVIIQNIELESTLKKQPVKKSKERITLNI